MNQASFFQMQFITVNTAGDTVVAAGYQLATYLAGTTDEEVTWEDQDGNTPNTNPIELDSEGYCSLWLDPAKKYKLVLLLPVAQGSGEVRVFDNVTPAAGTTNVVVSINGETGEVTFTANDIEYEPTFQPDWFTATDVGAAIDEVLGYLDNLDATQVDLVDTDNNFPPEVTNVEEALANLAGRANAGRLLRVTVISATGNWSAGTDTESILVKAVGGGGGGGVGGGFDGGMGGGGGGGGGYSERFINNPASPTLVTIGDGGTAGNDGEDTTFGAYLTAGGGEGGDIQVAGGGGTSVGGDINMVGSPGGFGSAGAFGGQSGHGGSSALGGGAKPNGNLHGGTGFDALPNTGGGGGGGSSTGGNGGSGIVIIYEYS